MWLYVHHTCRFQWPVKVAEHASTEVTGHLNGTCSCLAKIKLISVHYFVHYIHLQRLCLRLVEVWNGVDDRALLLTLADSKAQSFSAANGSDSLSEMMRVPVTLLSSTVGWKWYHWIFNSQCLLIKIFSSSSLLSEMPVAGAVRNKNRPPANMLLIFRSFSLLRQAIFSPINQYLCTCYNKNTTSFKGHLFWCFKWSRLI